MSTETGRGGLFLPDGRRYGVVEYNLEVEPGLSGKITGQLRLLEGGDTALEGETTPWGAGPFFKLMDESKGLAALRLTDGRWWLCTVQPDGAAVGSGQPPAGGFHPAGPQPKHAPGEVQPGG
jgi:hypothetical protein